MLAHQTLESFLRERGLHYQTEMSSPNSAPTSCSRMSTYLAFGNISMRYVYQMTKQSQENLGKGTRTPWRSSLASFQKRLRWHCHFMQKLEDEPGIEFENFNRGFDGLRTEFNGHGFSLAKR